jgi:CMP-N,N'-diacetyllegionaminic acid synthase
MTNPKMVSTAETILAIIPARAGSKGIPGKNIRLLEGKPLIGHAIECARRIDGIDRILLTTDSQEIAALGRSFGAETPFLRPPELATDDTPMLAVLQHAITMVSEAGWKPTIIVLLQPTAPFRRDADLNAALTLLQKTSEADSVVSVERVPSHYLPHIVMKVLDNHLIPFLPDGAIITRRQDASPAYSRNGQFYITRYSTLVGKNSIYGNHSIPYITMHKAVNLDTMSDWDEAKSLARQTGLPLK